MIEIDNILDVEKHLDGIEAVIFDLDDTLYSEKDYVRSGFHAVADAYPQIPSMFEELRNAFELKQPAIDTVFARNNILSEKDTALNIYRTHKPSISLYTGVREMLERIGKTKKLGIITDGRPEGQHAKIDALGIGNLFDEIIITDELGGVQFRKPFSASALLMSELMNVAAHDLLYIGDNISKDLIFAKNTGTRFILFKNVNGLYF